MRRQIIVLLAVLALPLAALAAYPEDYYGPPLPGGCMDVEAFIPHGWYLDRNPWSSVSPEEKIFWFGTLCVEEGIAVLEFTHFGSRNCYRPPWGSREDPETCYAGYVIEIYSPDRHVLPWDPDFQIDWGFYIAQIFIGDWQWSYESLTVEDAGKPNMIFVTGVFDYVQPLWYVESDEFTRWKMLVSPRIAKGFPMRRSVGRYGP